MFNDIFGWRCYHRPGIVTYAIFCLFNMSLRSSFSLRRFIGLAILALHGREWRSPGLHMARGCMTAHRLIAKQRAARGGERRELVQQWVWTHGQVTRSQAPGIPRCSAGILRWSAGIRKLRPPRPRLGSRDARVSRAIGLRQRRPPSRLQVVNEMEERNTAFRMYRIAT